jgi:RNA polymerase sigma-70 factor (ECF subfamily)
LDKENRATEKIEFDNSALAALIRKTGQGDTAAFTALYDCTSSLIWGIVSRILPEGATAEEVLLDVYTRIWKESSTYDSRDFMPLEWIITLARNQAILRLDASKETKKRTMPETGETDPATTVAPSLQQFARSSMESLNAPQREFIDWAFYTGLSSSEIAAQSQKPLGAVKIHIRIGMSKLYDLFRPLYERDTEPETANGGTDN